MTWSSSYALGKESLPYVLLREPGITISALIGSASMIFALRSFMRELALDA
jgi:hypothetical protein